MGDATGPDRPGSRPLVIGVGNPDRGDDGIGLAVVEHLRRRRPDVDTALVTGDLTVLPLLWRGRDDVVLVDGCRTGRRPPGTVVPIEPEELDADRSLSSHGVGLAFAIALGERIDHLPQRLRVVGIEIGDDLPGPLGDPLVRQVGAIAGDVASRTVESQGRWSLAR